VEACQRKLKDKKEEENEEKGNETLSKESRAVQIVDEQEASNIATASNC